MKVLMFICGAAAAMLVSAGESRTKTVTLDPSASILWKTAVAGQRSVSLLPWPEGAQKAELIMAPGGSAEITDTTLAVYDLQLPLPEKESDEYTLKLELRYKDGAGAVLETRRANLGVVCGMSQSTDIAYRTAGGRGWSRHSSRKPVVPVVSAVQAASLDAKALDVADAPTWVELDGGAGAWHSFAWTVDGGYFEQKYSVPAGTVIQVR